MTADKPIDRSLLTPLLRDRGVGEMFPYFAAELERVVGRGETNDTLSVLRLTLTPGGSPPLHMHTREDETWVVLAGEVKFWTGGQTLGDCETGMVSAGGVAYGPRLVPHTFQTHTPEAEVLIVMTPGMFEDHMLAIGTTEHAEEANSAEESAKFGVSILDRPPIFGKD